MSKYVVDIVHLDDLLMEMRELVVEMREIRRSLNNIEHSLEDPQEGKGIKE